MTICIIEELQIDSQEKNYKKALWRMDVGYVLDVAEAIKICEEAGCIRGTGWPIRVNTFVRKLTFRTYEPYKG